MGSAPFVTRLDLVNPAGRSAVITNLKPFRVDVQRAASGPQLPYSAMADSPPSQANVWLQIWTLGENEPKRWTGHPLLKPKAAPNQLCVEIPGYLQETESGFQFRVIGAAKKGQGRQLGWLWLALRDGRGQPILAGGREPRIPIVSEGQDDEVDLVCGLFSSPGNDAPPKNATPFFFTNLTHIIGAQLREGGLLLGFHVYLPDAKTDNDRSFPRFGEFAAQRTHCLGLRDGELTVDTTEFTGAAGEKMVLDAMQRIRQTVHRDFLGGQGEVPKINRFFTITHGSKDPRCNGIQMGSSYISLHVNHIDHRFDKLMDGLAPHLTRDVVWSQCSCHIAAPPTVSGTDYTALPKERGKIGEGSFADTCRKALAQRGLTDAAVWGHTSKGDCVRNQELRAFTRAGNMDLCYMVLGFPPNGKPIGPATWALRYMNSWQDADRRPILWELLDASLHNPTAFVEKALK